MSVCNICNVELTEFNKVERRRRCKECHKTIKLNEKKQWLEKNPNKQNEYNKRNLIKRQQRILCACGCNIQIRDVKRHETSKRHIENLKPV